MTQTCRAFAVLAINDGTTRIDLLNCGRWMLTDWEPFIPDAKGGGTWRDSPLSPGRQLIDYQRANWIDVFTLMLSQPEQNDVIFHEQELLRLLEKAVSYWTNDWQSEPVWIEARAAYETNTRYALIKGYRTPSGSGNPFGQPFFLPEPRSIIEDFELTIEHGPWLADAPGTGTCLETSARQVGYPYYLIFDETTSRVNCGSNLAIDNLPLVGFTAEAWIRAETWGANLTTSEIFNKGAWWVGMDSTNGIRGVADYAAQDAISYSGVDDFIPDGEWHHVAFTFQNPGGGSIFRIWIDGVEVSYTTQQAAAGAYTGDGAFDLFIGNNVLASSAFDGDIGWCRLSSSIRYNANFTPPERCALPAIDANTIAQWIGVEKSGATIDNQEGTAALDGTQIDCEFDSDCVFGRDETCLDEVYIANKHNVAQLTHIFVDDGGVFGVNLNGTYGYDLLPAVPAVNDAVYFGIDTTFADSGPFCSLVFDIGTAIVDVTGIAWEYWNGAWVALTVQDNTDADGAMTGVAFDTTGVGSVHWNQPSGWITNAVNGVTGYWVRARVTAIGAAPTAPTQQNRAIYTIVWGGLQIDSDQVTGDIPMGINLQISTQSGGSIASTSRPYSNRVITGLRSISRGENFVAYLNASDEQNPDGITVRIGATSAFVNDVTAPTGRRIADTGTHVLSDAVSWSFDNTISNHYYGTFHAFSRGQLVAGAAVDDVQIRLATGTGEGGTATFDQLFATDYVQFDAVGLTWRLLDFGQIKLPPAQINNEVSVIGIELQSIIANARTFYIHDLVLIPVDENGHEAIDPTLVLAHRVFYSNRIEMDSVTFPRHRIYTPLKDTATGEYQTPWRHIGPSGMLLQANADQKIWALAQTYYAGNWYCFPYVGHNVEIDGSARYLYARGNR